MDGCAWIDGATWAWQAATLAAAQVGSRDGGYHTQVLASRLVALASLAIATAAWAVSLWRNAHWWRR